jgi:2-keto-4-pentenoate hydratase/2-oxohepta-3-ene-1,7-dioic acid hydratase in catechol pathway
MKYCRFEAGGSPLYGEIEERDGEFWVIGLLASPWKAFGVLDGIGDEVGIFQPRRLSELSLLPPVAPSKIICVGRNYRGHAKELGNEVPAEPLLFFKPPSSLLPSGGTVRMPRVSSRVDYEGELAVIIGKRARRLSRHDDLAKYIHGYTLANDVTARDLQKKDGQWTRAKGFDTFCPTGPIVETELAPPTTRLPNLIPDLILQTCVNGEIRQNGSTADFIFPLPELLEYITAAITLEPGDLVLTGTPAGVGPLAAGDTVEIHIPGLGTLTNSFQPEEA